MTTKKTIYLIRHGQTDYNLRGIIQGRGIDSDLNERGRLQAQAFFRHYKEIPFQKIYTSTLKRTQQSVEPFLDLNLELETHFGLDEINWGVHEGQKATEEHRKIFSSITDSWRSGNIDFAPEGGESPLKLQERQKLALDFLLEKEHEETILVCMHGRAMRSFLCLMLNHPLNLMDDYPHTNLCLYKMAWKGDDNFEMLDKNNTRHLSDHIRSNFPYTSSNTKWSVMDSLSSSSSNSS